MRRRLILRRYRTEEQKVSASGIRTGARRIFYQYVVSGDKVEGHEARCRREIAYLGFVAVSCYNMGYNWFYQNDVNKNTCAKKSQIL